MVTLYPMAPGSGCQLNCGRVSEVGSPKGPNRENPVLAAGGVAARCASRDCKLAVVGAGGAARAGDDVGMTNAFGAGGRTDAVSVGDVAGAADGAGADDAPGTRDADGCDAAGAADLAGVAGAGTATDAVGMCDATSDGDVAGAGV